MGNFISDEIRGTIWEKEAAAYARESLGWEIISERNKTRTHDFVASYREIMNDQPFRVECKCDDMSEDTGNVAIEFEYKFKLSGISNTEALLWMHKYYEGKKKKAFITSTKILRDIIARKIYEIRWGGDNKLAKMYIIPVSEMDEFVSQYSDFRVYSLS